MSTPQVFGVPLANQADAFANIKADLFDAAIIDAAVLVNTDELVAQDAFLGSVGTPCKLFGADIRNPSDAGSVVISVPLGATAYALQLPPQPPAGLLYLASDSAGNMSWEAGGGGAWSSCFSGFAGAEASIPLGNQNEAKSDAQWAEDAAALGCQMVQQDQTSGAVVALTGATNYIAVPALPPGYTLAAGTSHRTLISPAAIIYKNLSVGGSYYSLTGYAFTSIQNYASGTAADESTAMTTAPPGGALGSAVVNMNGPGPVAFDYAPAALDADALPVALAGYTCFIRGEDLGILIDSFPGGWLSLPWQRTIYPTV